MIEQLQLIMQLEYDRDMFHCFRDMQNKKIHRSNEKILNTTSMIAYKYIAFTFNKVIGSGSSTFNIFCNNYISICNVYNFSVILLAADFMMII